MMLVNTCAYANPAYVTAVSDTAVITKSENYYQSDIINLASFGVLGDGSDESAKVQRAINASVNKTLVIPDGVFYCKNITINGNIKIDGKGTLKTHQSALINDCLLLVNNASHFSIKNVTLDGNKANTPGNASKGITLLRFNNCSNISCTNTMFVNNNYLAICTVNTSNSNFSYNTFKDVDCFILTRGGSKNITISNNTGDSGTSDGYVIWGEPDNYDSHISINHNSVSNKLKGGGVLVRYGNDIDVFKNNMLNCANGVSLEGIEKGSKNVHIFQNNIQHCNSGINGTGSNLVIIFNKITDMGLTGINITNADNNIIIENQITNVNRMQTNDDGIRLKKVTNSRILYNKVIDDRDKKINYSGIRLLANSSNNDVSHNSVTNATYPYLIANKDVLNTKLNENFGRISNSGSNTKIDLSEDLSNNTMISSSSITLPVNSHFAKIYSSSPKKITSIASDPSNDLVVLNIVSPNVIISSAGNIALKKTFNSKNSSILMLAYKNNKWIEVDRN
jgi:hypothetical protein